ncbi:nucleoside deaminase [Spiroplasma endosymbiont of Asaphidion curtum]|uniref:nucleoside deaminase n=1 Tax=Spiroplasma endosymbiont of Asaphidion curtum TaxID=3066281 RepID=UPI00313B4493
MPHIQYMKVAISLAKIAYQNGDVPVGAVIVDPNGIIIGQGYNSKEVNNNPLEHAEMVAIANAAKKLGQWRLKDCVLYSTLEPCLMCTGAILQSRIKKVFFAVSAPKFGTVVSQNQLLDKNKFNHQASYDEGLLELPVKQILQRFFQEVRKN